MLQKIQCVMHGNKGGMVMWGGEGGGGGGLAKNGKVQSTGKEHILNRSLGKRVF